MAVRKLMAGNWKMNGTRATLAELDPIGDAARACARVDVAICPPFTLIAEAAARADGFAVGGQDCHAAVKGAHTGSISAAMLADIGARYVIVGHSERRTQNGESDDDVHAKAEAALAAAIVPILCVGETEEQRQKGRAGQVVVSQLERSVPRTCTGDTLVIGYEPLWAIGSGRIPTWDDIARQHVLIRAKLIDLLGEDGNGVRILYGGSVQPANAADIMQVPEVGGVLVGGASLTAAQFVPIIEAGENVSQ